MGSGNAGDAEYPDMGRWTLLLTFVVIVVADLFGLYGIGALFYDRHGHDWYWWLLNVAVLIGTIGLLKVTFTIWGYVRHAFGKRP
jgi:hypothetical protein